MNKSKNSINKFKQQTTRLIRLTVILPCAKIAGACGEQPRDAESRRFVVGIARDLAPQTVLLMLQMPASGSTPDSLVDFPSSKRLLAANNHHGLVGWTGCDSVSGKGLPCAASHVVNASSGFWAAQFLFRYLAAHQRPLD